jgi:hypothetical protein
MKMLDSVNKKMVCSKTGTMILPVEDQAAAGKGTA